MDGVWVDGVRSDEEATLMGEAEGRRTSNDAVVLIAILLNLGHALTSAI